MSSFIDIQERVAAGIALLDQKGPSDWRDRISTRKLDMNSMHDCVLGQVYGNYLDGFTALALSANPYPVWHMKDVSISHGFFADIQANDNLEAIDLAFEQLTVAWKDAL